MDSVFSPSVSSYSEIEEQTPKTSHHPTKGPIPKNLMVKFALQKQNEENEIKTAEVQMMSEQMSRAMEKGKVKLQVSKGDRNPRSAVLKSGQGKVRDLAAELCVGRRPGDIHMAYFISVSGILKIFQLCIGLWLSVLNLPSYFLVIVLLSCISTLTSIWIYFASFNKKLDAKPSYICLIGELALVIDWAVLYLVVVVIYRFHNHTFSDDFIPLNTILGLCLAVLYTLESALLSYKLYTFGDEKKKKIRLEFNL